MSNNKPIEKLDLDKEAVEHSFRQTDSPMLKELIISIANIVLKIDEIIDWINKHEEEK